MGVHYNTSMSRDEHKIELEQKIVCARDALLQLQAVGRLVAASTSGDAEFDVEFTVAINVARAALLRLQSMLREQADTVSTEPGHEGTHIRISV